ncbi:MAG: hypothetical protein QXV17_05695 [Candidatus Micrarchaeaceae archaeon]
MNIESNNPVEEGLKEKRRLSAQLKTEERMNAKKRMSRDGTWTKKNSKSYFGFKLKNLKDLNALTGRQLKLFLAESTYGRSQND